MSNLAKLKKQAAELEQKKQYDKAIAAYIKLLEDFDANAAELDVALFNRVGDLLVRQSRVAEAVDYYEKAVDRYADGGFFNNAIALCNKILRSSPGRTSVYYKLGKISAQKGFKTDARKNFLEYADRVQKAGNMNEAFRALAEFADLCPDQDDVRLMLADQLSKADRKEEAIEQLQLLHERYTSEGRNAEAAAAFDRMRAIDPAAEPAAVARPARKKSRPSQVMASGLVFIDLDEETSDEEEAPAAPAPRPAGLAQPSAPPQPPSSPPPPPAPAPSAPEEAIELMPSAPAPADPEPVDSLLGLETTSMADEPPVETGGLLDLEQTSLGGGQSDMLELEPAPAEPAGDAGGGLDFIMPGDDAAEPEVPSPGADLPLMDLDIPAAAPAAPAPTAELDITFDAGLDIPLEIEPPAIEMKNAATLRSAVQADPENWGLRRELAERLIEEGDRDAAVKEFEAAMEGAERSEDIHLASAIAEEIGRLHPQTVRYHQKRVEYAFRLSDKPLLVEAYISLADALVRENQAGRARAVYQRVLEIAPDDIRAQAAMESIIVEEPPAPTPPAPRASIGTRRVPTPAQSARPVAAAPQDPADFVNLGDWLRDDVGPSDSRMVVEEEDPSGDENADFADMLRKFKQGVAENVEAEDYQSQYDLGVAYKEMGLIDEAIHQFQKALRGPTNRLPTYEAIGQCFIEKGEAKMAASILSRALNEPGTTEDQLIGVLYLLGRAAEATDRVEEAVDYYHRVLVVDITFRDVSERVAELERSAR